MTVVASSRRGGIPQWHRHSLWHRHRYRHRWRRRIPFLEQVRFLRRGHRLRRQRRGREQVLLAKMAILVHTGTGYGAGAGDFFSKGVAIHLHSSGALRPAAAPALAMVPVVTSSCLGGHPREVSARKMAAEVTSSRVGGHPSMIPAPTGATPTALATPSWTDFLAGQGAIPPRHRHRRRQRRRRLVVGRAFPSQAAPASAAATSVYGGSIVLTLRRRHGRQPLLLYLDC